MCPRCHSNEINRSKSWRFRDLFMKIGGMKPFRCQQCRTRFYLPARMEPGIVAEHRWLQAARHERPHTRHTPPE